MRRALSALTLLACAASHAQDDPAKYVKFVEEHAANCVMRNATQIQLKNTHPTRRIRVWLDRYHMGVGTGDRVTFLGAPLRFSFTDNGLKLFFRAWLRLDADLGEEARQDPESRETGHNRGSQVDGHAEVDCQADADRGEQHEAGQQRPRDGAQRVDAIKPAGRRPQRRQAGREPPNQQWQGAAHQEGRQQQRQQRDGESGGVAGRRADVRNIGPSRVDRLQCGEQPGR